jgi:hypothetical protein
MTAFTRRFLEPKPPVLPLLVLLLRKDRQILLRAPDMAIRREQKARLRLASGWSRRAFSLQASCPLATHPRLVTRLLGTTCRKREFDGQMKAHHAYLV